ncbi:methanogen output domain 1-containing protein [Thetidibacter halocola]|uniref:Transcriptional regulator n=1 Tax=Thetidibacter halocola TaxID=2827239 RepID=A0A8J7WDI7_9RHOB|nr:methanogen output domain 1-containing protein [Thetidibacter halocola]MBS0123398.1 transcriptional regulator [Thetidibacter halocola]
MAQRTERVPATDTLNAACFMSDMITSLSGRIEEMVGLEESSWFIAQVGQDIGRDISRRYRDADGALPDDPEAIGAILCDLKARIGGHFSVVSADADEIRLVASRCPFGEKVRGRASLCMMTTHVFGRIAADACGYSSVRIDEAIALGDPRCSVTVVLRRTSHGAEHEFYR